VSDEVKNDGVAALRRALQFLIDEKIASAVTIEGKITSVYGISWGIDISRPDGETSSYSIAYDRNKWDAIWKSYE
jgi:phage gp46-like protein